MVIFVFLSIHEEAEAKLSSLSPSYVLTDEKSQTISDLTSDLFGKDYFQSTTGKEARNLLLKYANGRRKLINEVIPKLKEAVNAGDSHALVWLGVLNSIDVDSLSRNDNQIVEFFKQAADAGDPFGLYKIGYLYEKGEFGFDKNPELAKEYYNKSIQNDGHWGFERFGDAYLYGNADLNIEIDIAKAIKKYEIAIEKGSLKANLELSKFYSTHAGLIFLGSEQKRMSLVLENAKYLCLTWTVYGAKGCFYQAYAEKQNIKLNKVNSIHHTNIKIRSDLRRAYELGDGLPEAYAFSALFLIHNTKSYNSRDEQLANELFERACVELKFYNPFNVNIIKEACLAVVLSYAFGLTSWNNKTVDLDKVKHFLAIVRKNKFSEVDFIESKLYENGIIYSKDLAKAYEFLKISEKKYGDVYSFEELANYYGTGTVVEKNHDLEHQYNGIAAKKGSTTAMVKYAAGFIINIQTGDVLENPDYRNCYLWSSVGYLRNPNYRKIRDRCEKKINRIAKARLFNEAKQLDFSIYSQSRSLR